MKTEKVIGDYSREKDSSLAVLALHIVTCLTGHLAYKALEDQVLLLKSLYEKFTIAIQTSQSGSGVSRAEKKSLRALLLLELLHLSHGVNFYGFNDLVLLLGSGFRLAGSSGSTKTRFLTPLKNVLIMLTTMLGIFDVKLKRQTSMYDITVLYTFEDPFVNPNTRWESYSTHLTSFSLNVGRKEGKVWFKIQARGKAGDMVESTIIEKVITTI